jgi:hypothetical protein
MRGPGRYDNLCSHVQMATQAQGIVLIIVNGNLGSGMSVQGLGEVMPSVPDLLRQVANEIEKDMKDGNHQGV